MFTEGTKSAPPFSPRKNTKRDNRPASASPPPPGALGVSSRLLLDLRMAGAVTGDSELAAVQDSSGNVELLARASTGTIYNIRRSNDDTGWSQVALDETFSASSLAIGSSGAHVVAFASGRNEASPQILSSTRDGSGEWGSWVVMPNLSMPANVGVRKLVAIESSGKIELYAFLETPPGQPDAGALSLWWVPWDAPSSRWTKLGSSSGTLCAAGNFKGQGEGLLAFQLSDTDPTTFDLMLYPAPANGKPKLVLSNTNAAHLTAARQDNGFSGAFIAETSWEMGTTSLSFVDGSVESPTPIPLPMQTANGCTQLQASPAGDAQPLTVFLVGNDNRLFVSRQPAHGVPWSAPFELGDRFTSMAQASNSQQGTELFGFDQSDTLRRFWETGAGPGSAVWQEAAIDLPADTMTQTPSYATRIEVRSPDGNLLPNTVVSLYSAETISAVVNGRGVVLGPNKATAVKTNNRATLAVYSRAELLESAKLRVVLDGSIDQHIQRDAHTKSVLASATVADVRGMLPPKFKGDATKVHFAVNSLMTTINNVAPASSAAHDVIDADNLADDFDFRFDVSEGKVNLSRLSHAESAALRTEYVASAQVLSLSSFWKWLGDIIEGAAHAVENAFTYVVSKVKEGIQIVIDMVIRGVKYVFSGIVNSTSEAFGLVTAIFSAVGVFFHKLFKFAGWLVTDAGADIWRTKAVISTSMTKLVPKVQGLIADGEGKIEAFVARLEAELEATFTAASTAVGNMNLNYNKVPLFAGSENAPSPVDMAKDNSAITTWFYDKLVGPGGEAHFLPSVTAQVIQELIAGFAALAEIVGTSFKNQLTEFVAYLQSVIKDPANFVALTLKELLNEVKELLSLALKFAEQLILTLMNVADKALSALLHGVFDQPIGGAFIGKIYNLINPGEAETPTVLDLFSLFAAIPATVLFRLFRGHAPFTDADVSAFAASDLLPAEHEREHGLARDNVFADSGIAVTGTIAACLILPFTFMEFDGDIVAWRDRSLPLAEPREGTVWELVSFVGGIALPGAILALSAPQLNWTVPEELWVNASWVGYLAPVLLNLVVWMGSDFKMLAPDTEVGAGIYCSLGVVILIIGAFAVANEKNRNLAKIWLSLVLPLPTISKFLIFIPEPLAIAALGAIDLVSDFGAFASALFLSLTEGTDRDHLALAQSPIS